MKSIVIGKEIKAKSIKKATEKFAKVLTAKGYDWAAAEMIESVEYGYYYCSNASEANLVKGGRPIAPKTNDWSYYWGIENIDGDEWYAWFIEREVA